MASAEFTLIPFNLVAHDVIFQVIRLQYLSHYILLLISVPSSLCYR